MELLCPTVSSLASDGQPAQQEVGQLKIFFGYAAGVGKTLTMLQAALAAKQAGVDVVCGCLSPHSTSLQVNAALEHLEQLPLRQLGSKGTAMQEFDLDAALTRRPGLILLSELAHTNAPGCRHVKRYQDVQELLRCGISVYATLNVQHLESLNDVVAAITGFTVSDRIPDQIFDLANQVEVVDREPGQLLAQRSQHKAVGTYTLSEHTLTALREIALRRTADRLGRSTAAKEGEPPKAREHIMICLSPSPSNAKVIRTAARMAEAFHGVFTALFVETPSMSTLGDGDRKQLQSNLRLAEELGARITTVYGDDPAVQIAEYAKVSGISKIILGRSHRRKSFFPSSKTLIDRLGALAPDLDVYIIPDQTHKSPKLPGLPSVQEHFSWRDLSKTIGILAVCTIVGYGFKAIGLTTANIIMIYILGVLGVSMATSGRSYSLLASVLSVLIFNFFFTYPYFTLMSDPSYIATFFVMLLVALLGSSLTTRIKRQAIQSANKAYRTQVLLETSQKLQKAESAPDILTVTAQQLCKLLERDVIFYPMGANNTLQAGMAFPLATGGDVSDCVSASEQAVAQWVLQNNKHAGATTNTLPSAACLYMAVRGADQVLAVAGIAIRGERKPDAFEKNLMVAILDECGLALEKEQMIAAKQAVEEQARQEALRANLLRAISHDLRTPLTSISGHAGLLMDNSSVLDVNKRQQLYCSIYDDSMWLINLVENLLSITRMENGFMKLNLQAELLDEVFQEALSHLDRNACKHVIRIQLEDDMLMANLDARLIVQVVINLVNNAIKYTPEGSKITLSARQQQSHILVTVWDDGPGIADEVKPRLFDMFYTADNTRGDGRRGLGLGLSLCKSIIAAHGGSIWVETNQPQGARFCFTLQSSEVTAHE